LTGGVAGRLGRLTSGDGSVTVGSVTGRSGTVTVTVGRSVLGPDGAGDSLDVDFVDDFGADVDDVGALGRVSVVLWRGGAVAGGPGRTGADAWRPTFTVLCRAGPGEACGNLCTGPNTAGSCGGTRTTGALRSSFVPEAKGVAGPRPRMTTAL